MSAIAVSGGLGAAFADPVLGAQRCFRLVLTGMSEPGTVHRLGESVEAPHGVSAAATRVVLTLADYETPVWLHPRIVEAAAPYIRFHCGAPIVEHPMAARFAVIEGSDAEPGLAAFDAGDDRYPDRSATVIVQCLALHGGEAVELSGPGLRASRRIAPAGLHGGFWSEVSANGSRYPLGVDLIFCAGDEILCVPRSTRIADMKGRR